MTNYIEILENEGLEDCLRALCHGNEPTYKIVRWLAACCAERAIPIYEKQIPGDDRIRKCNEVNFKLLIKDESPPREGFIKAWHEAERASAAAAEAAWAVASAAGHAANAVVSAAYCAFADSAAFADGYAFCSAARAADNAARSAAIAAFVVKGADWNVYDAAKAAERSWQASKLRELLKDAASNEHIN